VAAAIGVRGDYLERARRLFEAEVDALVIDVAHGHSDLVIEAIRAVKRELGDVEVVGGNVVTPEAVEDLYSAGADAVRVGIGAGAVCTIRIVAGVGVPQLTAIMRCAEKARNLGIPVIADGGSGTPAMS